MAQIKIYGLRTNLSKRKILISDAIHQAVMNAFKYPAEKKFHRFIALEKSDFIFPADRSDSYTIIEISIFTGRSTEAKKALIREIFNNMETQANITPQDIEITIFESPQINWGIRGQSADELTLNYKVDV